MQKNTKMINICTFIHNAVLGSYQYAKNMMFMNEKLCVPAWLAILCKFQAGDKILDFHIINSDMSQKKSYHGHPLQDPGQGLDDEPSNDYQ